MLKPAEEMILPVCDEWGVPLEKMPLCPNCGEDELGMIRPGMAMCYFCGKWYKEKEERVLH